MDEKPTAIAWALRVAVSEIDTHVATGGWDGPVRLFSLVDTKAALDNDPAFARDLPADIRQEADGAQAHFTSVEQEGLPQVDDVEALLTQIAWPEAVAGTVLVLERVVLPPAAEAELGPNPKPEDYLQHPARDDVRICCGVLRSGETWTVLRVRGANEVIGGENLVPNLPEALAQTFS